MVDELGAICVGEVSFASVGRRCGESPLLGSQTRINAIGLDSAEILRRSPDFRNPRGRAVVVVVYGMRGPVEKEIDTDGPVWTWTLICARR